VHTRLAAETHLADGEFLQVAANREEFKGVQKNNDDILWVIMTSNLYINKIYNESREIIYSVFLKN
jgi:hypothetical protein